MRDCGLSLNVIIIFIIVTAAVCAMLAVYQARFRVPYVCYSFNPHNMLFPLPGNTVLPNLVMAGFLSFRSYFRYHLFRGAFPDNPVYTPPPHHLSLSILWVFFFFIAHTAAWNSINICSLHVFPCRNFMNAGTLFFYSFMPCAKYSSWHRVGVQVRIGESHPWVGCSGHSLFTGEETKAQADLVSCPGHTARER